MSTVTVAVTAPTMPGPMPRLPNAAIAPYSAAMPTIAIAVTRDRVEKSAAGSARASSENSSAGVATQNASLLSTLAPFSSSHVVAPSSTPTSMIAAISVIP